MPIGFATNHPFTVARTQSYLPGDSFIRALPFTVDETQRFRMDALVMGADILAAAYVQLIEMALRSKWEQTRAENERSRHPDIAMFQHAWSMVDQIYSLQQLLRSLKFKGDDIDAFMSATAAAYILRNRMDHLDARIPNIAASKSQTRSLYGSLSYFVSGAAVGSPQVDVFLVTQQAEPVRPAETVGAGRFPDELRMPIGNFTLSAAGEMVDLDNAVLTMRSLMVRTNESCEKSIRGQIAEAAVEHGVAESKLLAHYVARYKLMLALKISDTSPRTYHIIDQPNAPAAPLGSAPTAAQQSRFRGQPR